MRQQNFKHALIPFLFCWLILPAFSQTNTFVICPGESVFLPAQQVFAAGPAPPGGGFPCRPQLRDIEISPASNAVKEETRGYTVTPAISTLYKVTSLTTCGPVGPGSTPSPSPDAVRNYQVLVTKDCQSYTLPTYDWVLQDYPWLSNKVNPTECGNLPLTTFYEKDGKIMVRVFKSCAESSSV